MWEVLQRRWALDLLQIVVRVALRQQQQQEEEQQQQEEVLVAAQQGKPRPLHRELLLQGMNRGAVDAAMVCQREGVQMRRTRITAKKGCWGAGHMDRIKVGPVAMLRRGAVEERGVSSGIITDRDCCCG